MAITTVTAPAAKAGKEYNWCFQLNGDFELIDTDAPAGVTISQVGQAICTRGTMTAEDGIVAWRAQILQSCGVSQTIVASITIEASCDAGCTYYWSITPTISVPGAAVTTTFTPPPGCPPDVTLSLDLFAANGTTPILIEGVAASITVKPGTTVRVNEYADRNTVVVFKPSVTQQRCVGCCTPSISSQRRVVIDAPPCTINWLIGTQQFQENVGALQKYYSNNIPPNCSVRFQLYIGASLVPETYGSFTLTHDQPVIDVGTYKFPFGTAGVDFNYRPDAPVGLGCQNCVASPARIDIDISAGIVCGVNWSLEKVSFVAGAANVSQIYAATGVPPGCSIRFDLYIGNVIQGYGGFTLSADQPSITTSVGFPAAGVTGLDFNYRPTLPLVGACLAAQCGITPARIDFDVTAGAACGINWDLLVKRFFANTPQDQTYRATGIPPNCSVSFDLYDGNTLLPGAGFSLTEASPSVTVSSLNFPPASVGADYNYRPVAPLAGACAACSISPARVDFDVAAAGACVIQWDLYPSPVAVGQSSGVRVLSGPPNCAISFQAYQADGITIIPGALITIVTNGAGTGASAQGACTTAGTAVWKPASPQASACALACSFGIQQFTHICSAGGSPPPGPSQNLCAAGTFEGGTSATFPVNWRASPATSEYDQVSSAQLTDVTPLRRRVSIAFTIASGATSLGATQLPFIVETPGAGASAIATNASISRNRCDFTPAAGVTYVLGNLNSHSNSLSVNDATLSGGGEFNLTSGLWYYNIELPATLPVTYNYNRVVDFVWYA